MYQFTSLFCTPFSTHYHHIVSDCDSFPYSMGSLLVCDSGCWNCYHHSDLLDQIHPTAHFLLPLLYPVSL